VNKKWRVLAFFGLGRFCHLEKKVVPEMTYTVSDGTLNPTHSLTVECGNVFLRCSVDSVERCLFYDCDERCILRVSCVL